MHCNRLAARITALAAACIPAAATLAYDESNVLLLYNSQNAESLAVRNAYLAAHPGVRQFDFNNATIPTQNINRFDFNVKIRAPLLNFINGVSTPFEDISQEVVVMVTTRGLPTRLNGGAEFMLSTSYASVESELSLIQQDLEVAGTAPLLFRYSGVIDNPFHVLTTLPIDNWSRVNIKTPKNFTIVGPTNGEHWWATDLTPGDIYLVCRLDAAPTTGANPRTAVENIEAMIERSQNLVVSKCKVQVLLDEYQASANQFDDDSLLPRFPVGEDFEMSAQVMNNQGWSVLHDETTNFVTGPELPDARPLIILGTYGENHDFAPPGENPPGNGTYLDTYTFDPAAMFVSYESFNAHDISGQTGSDHEQVSDFIAAGGSFAIGHVAEPTTFFVADVVYLFRAMMISGRTFAEAAYNAMPALSITTVPIGDPLARITVVDTFVADVTEDGVVDVDDLNAILGSWLQNVGVGNRLDVAGNDGVINVDDLNVILGAWLESCP